MENKNEFKPYIPAEKITPELTVTSIIMGVLLAVIFGNKLNGLGPLGSFCHISVSNCTNGNLMSTNSNRLQTPIGFYCCINRFTVNGNFVSRCVVYRNPT